MAEISFSEAEKNNLDRLGVEAVVLFGSRAQGVADSKSDYDIGVLTAPGVYGSKIYDRLYDLLGGKIDGLVDIDIVFLAEAPMELQFHAAKYGRILFEKSAQKLAEFKERVMTDYADFAPYRQLFQQATLQRISA